MKSILLALCIAVFNVPALAQTVLPSEPAAGMLGAGQSVYVACGPGKARKITGGSNRTQRGEQTNGGAGRTRGPCVPMKH